MLRKVIQPVLLSVAGKARILSSGAAGVINKLRESVFGGMRCLLPSTPSPEEGG